MPFVHYLVVWAWDPDFNTEVSGLLKRARLKAHKWAEEPTHNEAAFKVNFLNPRKIYIKDLMNAPFPAWFQHSFLQREPKETRFHDIELSHSFLFLLRACCEVLAVPATRLYEELCNIETLSMDVTESIKEAYEIAVDWYDLQPPGKDEKLIAHCRSMVEELDAKLVLLKERRIRVYESLGLNPSIKPEEQPKELESSPQTPKQQNSLISAENQDPEASEPQTGSLQNSDSQILTHGLKLIPQSHIQEMLEMSLSEFQLEGLLDLSSQQESNSNQPMTEANNATKEDNSSVELFPESTDVIDLSSPTRELLEVDSELVDLSLTTQTQCQEKSTLTHEVTDLTRYEPKSQDLAVLASKQPPCPDLTDSHLIDSTESRTHTTEPQLPSQSPTENPESQLPPQPPTVNPEPQLPFGVAYQLPKVNTESQLSPTPSLSPAKDRSGTSQRRRTFVWDDTCLGLVDPVASFGPIASMKKETSGENP